MSELCTQHLLPASIQKGEGNLKFDAYKAVLWLTWAAAAAPLLWLGEGRWVEDLKGMGAIVAGTSENNRARERRLV